MLDRQGFNTNWLFVLYVGTLVWLPLAFGSNQPMFWFYGQVFLQIITFCVLCLLLTNQIEVTSAFRRAWLPLLLLVMFAFLQIIICYWPGLQVSIDLQASRQELIKTICLLEVFCLTLLLVDSQSRFVWLVRILVYAGTFQAVYGTLMTVTGIEHIWHIEKSVGRGQATGTFINRNHLAGYLEMALALGLGLIIANLAPSGYRTWRAEVRSWIETLLGEKVRIRICLILMVIALILTRSRMGNTAFFVGMGVAGLIGLYTFRKSHTGVLLLFTSIIIIDILLMGAFFGIEELQQRFEETNLEQEARTSVVALGSLLISERPLFGYGAGAFYTAFPSVRDIGISGFHFHADADIVEFPIEYGLVGVTLLLCVFLVSLVTAIRVQLVRRNPFYKAMGFAATMAMVSIAVHTTADFNLHVFANAATFVCILAMPWLALALSSRNGR